MSPFLLILNNFICNYSAVQPGAAHSRQAKGKYVNILSS